MIQYYKILKFFNKISEYEYLKYTRPYIFKKTKDYKVVKKSKLFDVNFYLKHNPDVKELNMDPIEHYIKYGWREDRKCCKNFDEKKYIQIYPNIVKDKINPLVHYELYGKKENKYKNAEYIKPLLFNSRNTLIKQEQLDILILVKNIQNGSSIYRGVFLKKRLEKEFSVQIEDINNISKSFHNNFYSAKIILFVRPSMDDILTREIIKEIKKYNKKFIFDIDDLYILEYVKFFGGIKSNPNFKNPTDVESSFITKLSHGYFFADHITVSTQFIANELKSKYNLKNISVIPNVIDVDLCKIGTKEKGNTFNLLYVSGSNTHFFDISTIYLDLLNILLKYPDVKLTIFGKTRIGSQLTMFGDRIRIVYNCKYNEMLKVYSEHDLVLVPLDINPFNNAKSNIKYIEAGAVGVPVLASKCDEFKMSIRHNENGFLYDEGEIFKIFEDIYENKNKLKIIGENAHKDILENFSTNTNLPNEFKMTIKQLIEE